MIRMQVGYNDKCPVEVFCLAANFTGLTAVAVTVRLPTHETDHFHRFHSVVDGVCHLFDGPVA